MKIIIVGPAHPYRGGIAKFNEVLAQCYTRQGHEVEIVNFKLQYPSFLFPGTTQYTDAAAPSDISISREIHSINPFNWGAVARKIIRRKPDWVIFRYWMPFMAPALGTIARRVRKAGIRTVALTDNIIPHEKHFYDQACTNYFLGGIDKVVYMSSQVGRELDLFKFKGEKAFAPHPIYDTYGPKVSREEAGRSLGLDPSQHYVMFFGFIRHYKGLDLLLKAWALLPKVADRKLLIAGEFYSDKQEYLSLIEQLNIGDDVILHDTYIPEDKVAHYFSLADMVVQPYRSATQSGITQLAYHFEVAMLVTDVGGLAEIVPDQKVGYVVPVEPKAIAEALEDFYQHQRQAEFEKQITQEKLRFSWDHMIEALK